VPEDRCPAHAVDIVVAINDDAFLLAYCPGDPRRPTCQIFVFLRFVQTVQFRIEECPGRFDVFDAAVVQDLRDNGIDVELRRYGPAIRPGRCYNPIAFNRDRILNTWLRAGINLKSSWTEFQAKLKISEL